MKHLMVTETTSKESKWEKLMSLYGEGAGDAEIARALGITMRKFYELIEEVVAFSEFVERGRTLARAWWEEQGRIGLFREKFPTPLYSLVMKNRFGWADKIDTSDTTNKDPIDLDQAKAQVALALKVLVKKHPELLNGANLNPIENAND